MCWLVHRRRRGGSPRLRGPLCLIVAGALWGHYRALVGLFEDAEGQRLLAPPRSELKKAGRRALEGEAALDCSC